MFASGKTATVVSNAISYIEDVFSTYLYTGTGASLTITNGIDLSTKGGLVWNKPRDTASNDHTLYDTARGVENALFTNLTDAQTSKPNSLTAFNTTGFSLSTNTSDNASGRMYASWTFREQPKFFDVVTWTGNGGNPRAITHSLGSVPACIIFKNTISVSDWFVYHRSLATSKQLKLNLTDAESTNTTGKPWNTTPTSTEFYVGGSNGQNVTDETYVAYLFAHDAGGFGLTGTDNVISCGSFTTDGSGNATVSLGYEPQWILFKTSTLADDWRIFDVTRGLCDKYGFQLNPNTQAAEANIGSNGIYPTSTGFVTTGYFSASQTVIYVAIRRGPMKVPTSGTSVFAPIAYTGTNVDNRLVDTGILTDMTMARIRTATSTGSFYTADRLRGNTSLGTAIIDAENTDADSFMTPTVGYGGPFSAMNGFGVGNDVTRQLNQSSTSQLAYAFKRAPSFFDEVCYTGTGVLRTITHNLGVVPELIIIKKRSAVGSWVVYASPVGNTKALFLNSTSTPTTDTSFWNNTSPTASVFTVNVDNDINDTNKTQVAYLFATCAGVSKVGSYTGTGALQTINCGFTSSARFILIKRTNATGDWWLYDSARGITSGNDPYILINTTAAEVTGYNYVDTDSTGFQVTAAAADINTNADTYIFLAIA